VLPYGKVRRRYVDGHMADHGGVVGESDVPGIVDGAVLFVDLGSEGAIRNDKGATDIDANRARPGNCVVNGNTVRFDGDGMGIGIRNLSRPIRIRHGCCAATVTSGLDEPAHLIATFITTESGHFVKLTL